MVFICVHFAKILLTKYQNLSLHYFYIKTLLPLTDIENNFHTHEHIKKLLKFKIKQLLPLFTDIKKEFETDSNEDDDNKDANQSNHKKGNNNRKRKTCTDKQMKIPLKKAKLVSIYMNR